MRGISLHTSMSAKQPVIGEPDSAANARRLHQGQSYVYKHVLREHERAGKTCEQIDATAVCFGKYVFEQTLLIY